MLTAEQLKAQLHYCPDTGLFTRLKTGGGAKRGDIAGGPSSDGYTSISVCGVRYRAARLAYLWMTGSHPSQDVDHVNRNRRDDRWCNLRPASRSQNCANTKARSGLKGACWVAAKGKWKAQIRVDGIQRHIGYFDSAEAAHQAYMVAAVAVHGQYAGA